MAYNGGKTAEVPVLRLRQAFWLFAVGGCYKPAILLRAVLF
jgi:hypothetical protein